MSFKGTPAFRSGPLGASPAEAIVSSDDYTLSMGGGVSAAISRAAGTEYRDQAQRIVRAHLRTRRRPSAGDVIVTPAGKLPAKYVLHAITRGAGGGYLS